MKKPKDNPMNEANQCVFPNARQCSASSKRTGCQCKAPAMTGKRVCRFHGGKAGAPSGPRNGRYRSGAYTADAMASRISVRELIRTARSLMAEI